MVSPSTGVAVAVTFAVMRLNVADFGIFTYIKGVDTVVFGSVCTAVVNTSAGNNGYITVIADVEIVVYQFF